MAVTGYFYGNALVGALQGEIDFPDDTIKVALLEDTYTPNQDAHDFWDDVSANEASGTGYTAGGETLANKSLTYDTGSNTVVLDADDTAWTNSTITARYAVVYDDSPATAAEKRLIALIDFGQNESSSNGTFQITWNANGIATISIL